CLKAFWFPRRRFVPSDDVTPPSMTTICRRVCLILLLAVAYAAAQTAVKPNRDGITAASGAYAVGTAKQRPIKTNAKSQSAPREAVSVTLLGSVVPPPPAESFALSGSLAYTCDDNEISVIDISN